MSRTGGPDSGGAGPWLLVSGDFTPLGGMDRANLALASYLAGRGGEVHLVTHRAWPDLEATPGVVVHRVPRPLGSHLLGEALLDREGRRWARRLSARGARVVVNGGNCRWGDVNWVHYVHAAWRPRGGPGGGVLRRVKRAVADRRFRRGEREALRLARLVVANSERTRRDVIEGLGVPPERVHAVYYGADAERFRPPTPAERAEARAALGWAEPDDRPAVAFVGALGDARKGFDTLFAAWRRLARGPGWDARLVVVGAGATLPAWRARAADEGLGDSVSFLGFRGDVPRVLAACDLLVSPTRYEAYGLNVQEALCCGLPAIVAASAGVAERYPESLAALLLPDPDDDADLAARIAAWRAEAGALGGAVAELGRELRGRGWDRCAAEIVALAGS
jgi:glycosyltransferase involved in cell wall biosynthesis